MISDFRFQEQIEREAPHVTAVMRKKTLSEALAKICDRRGYRRLAIAASHVTLAQRQALAKQLGGKRLVNVDDGLLDQRAVKDTKEIASIRKAVGVTQEAFKRTLRFVKPGRTEYEVAAHLEYQMRLLGAGGCAFASIVAVGANAALPHAIPGKTKIRRGNILLFDWGAVVDGYCGDLTRVVGVGGMGRKMREIYQIVLDAHDAAISQIGPGRTLREIDGVARDHIRKSGYAKQFGHALGHGIGLDVHEQPVLHHRSKGDLQPGHIVTVEPGIYLPGVGGVRIESDVLVTGAGRRVLSDLPTDLESAIIRP